MNVYEIVNKRITELLEEGTVPWRKPWRSSEGPRNLISKKAYRGINAFLLNASPYESDFYLTYNQAKQKGGAVRKGEKSTVVVFWKWLERKDSDDSGSPASPGSPTTGKIPLLRYYNVFNLDQVDGIDPPKEEQISNPFTPIEQAEQIIQSMPLRPSIRYEGNSACYRPASDVVTLPPKEAFHSSEEFYSTLFHEAVHATGHSSRLGRKSITDTAYFGSHDYSQEELVAEFGASMLCGVSGIEQSIIENSAAYIQGWLKALRNDKKCLVLAAAQGQKSADYILNRQTDNQQDN
jgi:antirestriction protein ArdC